MKTHKNARDVLPDRLLREVQQYISGDTLYIPQTSGKRAWGESSGARSYYKQRNEAIREKYANGTDMEKLCEEYHLSYDSIRKIVNTKTALT